MNLLPNRSKKYVAVLLGGHPSDADKALELVADKQQRLSFIYGLHIFVIYFYSKKSIYDIENVFLTTLKKQIDMIFVFPSTKNVIQYMAPHLKAKMEMVEMDRRNIIGSDMAAFRDIIATIGDNISYMRPPSPVDSITPQLSEHEEASLSDNDILNELLTKIKKTGYSSLSPAELDFLKIYKDKHRKDNQKDQNDVD